MIELIVDLFTMPLTVLQMKGWIKTGGGFLLGQIPLLIILNHNRKSIAF